MSAFTKVLILIVCLLSAVFAASQVVLYGKREDFGKKFRDAREQLQAVTGQRDTAQREVADLRKKADDLKADLEGKLQGLEADLAAQQREVQRLTAELDKQSTSVQMLTETNQRLHTDMQTKDATIVELRDTLQERAGDIETKLAEIEKLNTQVADAAAKIGNLENNILGLKKDKMDLAEKKSQYQRMVSDAIERGVNFAAMQVPPIDALVVRVDPELGIAVIDKGAAAEVQPNTGFTVYNDEGFVASLVIHDVDSNMSVGRVIRLAEGRQLQVGDRATTKVQ